MVDVDAHRKRQQLKMPQELANQYADQVPFSYLLAMLLLLMMMIPIGDSFPS